MNAAVLQLADMQMAITSGRLTWRIHALERMLERDISRKDVRTVVVNGEIIEEYPSSYIYPACLVCGTRSRGPLHVVIAWDAIRRWAYIITAYVPDEEHFTKDFRVRRRGE